MRPVTGRILRLLTIAILPLLCRLPLAAQAPSWLHAIGGGSRFGNDRCFDVLLDQEGNSYLLAQFIDTLRVGPVSVPARTGYDLFLTKLDRAGRILWWRAIRGAGTGYPHGLGLTEDGALYIAVSIIGDADFGDTTVAGQGYNELVASYDPDGTLRWIRRIATVSAGWSGTIAAARGGGCAVAFSLYDTVSVGSTLLTSAGGADVAVARLDGDGTILWARSFGGELGEIVTSIGVDGTGGVYVAGAFSSTSIRLDSISVQNAAVAPQHLGSTDVFIAALNADGTGRYLRSAGDTYQDYLADIAVDPDGNLYAVGQFATRTRFDDVSLEGTPSGCGFISSYDRTGALQWARSFCGDSAVFATAVALDFSSSQSGDAGLYLTGGFARGVSFGDTRLESRGDLDVFVLHCDHDGAVDWARSAGGAGGDYGNDISPDGKGGCVVVGDYSVSSNGTVTTGAAFGTDTVRSNGMGDFFVAWLGPAAGVAAPSAGVHVSPTLDPNPVHDRARVSLDLDRRAPVCIEIVDMLGTIRRVATEGTLEPGAHRIPVGVSDLGTGVYLCRVVVDGRDWGSLPLMVR
jgi:hypothetical protein